MKPSILLSGPTGSGKSRLAIDTALELQEKFGVRLEIINADSVCFYRELNIGSAKPTPDELQQVPHHLINCASLDDEYQVARFTQDVKKIRKEIESRGARSIIVGGSGFYLKALRYGIWSAPETDHAFRETLTDRSNESLFQELKNIDTDRAEKISVSDRYRLIRALEIFHLTGQKPSQLEKEMNTIPNPELPLWIIDWETSKLESRMMIRLRQMIEQGWIDEVQNLLKHFSEDHRLLKAVGYRQILSYLKGEKPEGRKIRDGLDGLQDEIFLSHRKLAKSQRTWFKGLHPEQSFLLPENENHLKVSLIQFYQ